MADAFRLVTPRTLIRSVAAADLATLYAIATRPEVARMLFVFAPDMGRAAFDAIFPPGAQVPPVVKAPWRGMAAGVRSCWLTTAMALAAQLVLLTYFTSYGRDAAVASTLFYRDTAPGRVGRQMQTWVRFPEGWRVVAAHVSVIDEPKEAP